MLKIRFSCFTYNRGNGKREFFRVTQSDWNKARMMVTPRLILLSIYETGICLCSQCDLTSPLTLFGITDLNSTSFLILFCLFCLFSFLFFDLGGVGCSQIFL